MDHNYFNQNEKQSALAKKMAKGLEERLAVLRAKNDDCPIENTEKLRGRIREIKNLLNVLAERPAFDIESSDSVD